MAHDARDALIVGRCRIEEMFPDCGVRREVALWALVCALAQDWRDMLKEIQKLRASGTEQRQLRDLFSELRVLPQPARKAV